MISRSRSSFDAAHSRVVVGDLRDVIRDIGHTWMIGLTSRQLSSCLGWWTKPIGLRVYRFLPCILNEDQIRPSKVAYIVGEAPKDMSEITMDEWLKIGNNSSGSDHYLHSYLI